MASDYFAGMTGAAVSDTAAIGTMLIPAMVDDGYDVDFSAAVTAASSIIGPTIPPSNMMVIYGSLMNVSIAGLFAAGFLPGIVLAILLMIMSAYLSYKRGYPKGPKTTFRQKLVGIEGCHHSTPPPNTPQILTPIPLSCSTFSVSFRAISPLRVPHSIAVLYA